MNGKRKFAVVVLILFLAACNPQTNYQLWTTAGQLTDSWLNVYAAHWDSRAQFDSAWAEAGQDILNWKPGTQCQNVEQAINDALAIIAKVPVTDPKAALILSTAIVGAEVVQAYFVKCSQTPASFGVAAQRQYSPVLEQAVEKQRQTPATSAKELKQQWKAVGGK